MKEGIKFYFDGYSSENDLGLYNCTMSSGLFEEPFLSERSINEVQIRGRDEPYFQGVTRSPLSFSLTFAFKDTWDEEKIRFVARVLDQSTYKPFYTEANPNRIFYCMLVSSPRLLHNGLSQGYCELEFRCNSPYSYSPVYTSEIYDLSNNETSTNIEFINRGDKDLHPEIWITKVGHQNGDISILNQSNGGQVLNIKTASKERGVFTLDDNVSLGETVTIGTQIYEFDNSTGVAAGNIAVNLDEIGNPTIQPTLTQLINDTVLPSGTYYVKYSWYNDNGETSASPESSLAVTGGNKLDITIPSKPAAATGAKIYISASSGTEKYQGSTTATNYNQLSPIDDTGIPAPTTSSASDISNPTVSPTLAQSANITLLPAGTYYVGYSWVNPYGQTITSPEASILLTGGYKLNVGVPAFPTGVTKANIYIGTATGGAKQGEITTSGSIYTQISSLSIGEQSATSNTTLNKTAQHAVAKLASVMNGDLNGKITAVANTVSCTVDVRYQTTALSTNITVSDTCVNGSWDRTTFAIDATDGLVDGETVYVDCENEHIETDLSNTWRYDHFSGDFLSIIRGRNILNVSGKCKLYFRYQLKTLQG